MNWFTIVEVLLPVVLGLIPRLPPQLIPIIVKAIKDAQAAGWSSTEKKNHVMSQTQDAIRVINTEAGRTVIDPVETLPVVNKAVDTGVKMVKELEKHQ